jgi:hypothetical protein
MGQTGSRAFNEFEIDNNGCLTKYHGEAEHVEIPGGVKSIGREAFKGCSSLKSVTIPESVTSIGEQAFKDCTSLNNVTIPESVKSIGAFAFWGCTSLQSVIIPGSLKRIARSAFSDCISLTEIDIQKGVTSIGEFAFADCWRIQRVIIPERVMSIGEGAFRECLELTTIRIPASVTGIGEIAFRSCDKLEFIVIDNEAARAKIYALLPDDLHSKVITQAAHQYHLKEKEKIIVSVLSEYLLEDASQTLLRYFDKQGLHNGNTHLLQIIFDFLSIEDFEKSFPALFKALEAISFSDVAVPRMYPARICDEAEYKNSLNNYQKALQHAVTQYATVSTEIIEGESETAITASNSHFKM